MSVNILRIAVRGLVLLALAGAVEAQIVGKPWTGQPAVKRTMSDLVVYDTSHPQPSNANREALPRRILPNASQRVNSPKSPAYPVSLPNPNKVAPSARDGPRPEFAQSVAASFTGITYPQSGGFVPPDSHGDVGPTQVLAVVNATIRTIDKSTGSADGVLNVNANNFWAPVSAGSPISEQRVIFDRLTQRWFIVTINTSLPNRILLALSDNALITPSTVWTLYQFQQDAVSPVDNDSGLLCDYPNVGIDVNAVYIGCNMFDATDYFGSSIFIINKNSVLTASPISVTVFRDLMGQVTNPTGPGPTAPKGVTNFDPTATDGYFIGDDNQSVGILDLVRITDPGGTPTMIPFVQITAAAFQLPLPVEHKGNNHILGPGTGLLDGNDTRVMNASMQNGTIWLAHGTALDSTGNGGTSTPDRDGVRWYQVGSPAGTPTILQSGTIFDPSVTPTPRSYTYGSVNVSGQGHAAFGFTLVGADDYASVGTDGRLLTDSIGTTQGVQLATVGLAAYNNTFDNGQLMGGVRRWGNFSNTQVDPDDNMTFWTIQECTEADGTWATRVVRLQAPPPATPSSVSPSTIAPGQASVLINVAGQQISGSGFYDPGSGYSNRLDVTIADVVINSITYNGPTSLTLDVSTVGSAAGSRDLTIINPDGQTAVGAGLLTIGAVGGKSASTTSVASSLNPSSPGQLVTFTATVAATPPGSGTPTGSVDFFDGFALLGNVPLVAGSAVFSTAALTAGIHNISAAYSGDASFYSSVAPVLDQQVQNAGSTLTVTNNLDAGAGSLRATIAAAQAGDTIVFSLACPSTIVLTSTELIIDKSIAVVGPGARCLTISGNNARRIFNSNALGSNVGISGMTITNGRSSGGGAILNSGANLTLTAVAITNSNGLGTGGGGIDNELGTLLLANSTVSGNQAQNRAGGILSQGGTMTIVNSTITNNQSARGGGLRNAGGATTTIIDSTVSNNTATGGGSSGGNLSALNGVIQLKNTIVAEGVGTNPNLDPAGGTYTSLDYNQIQSGAITLAPNDIFGPTLALGALANNGGPTDTRLPPVGSAVIDKIPAAGGCNGAGVTSDQRGIARPQGATCDIGAVETGATIGVGATTTTLGTSGSPSTGGQAVTFTATVTGAAPTGIVTFYDGASILGTGTVAGGVATLISSTLGAGSHVITATYSGDAANAQSTSAPLTQVVGHAATSIVVVADVNPIAPGASLTFTATVTPPALAASPTGTVIFYDGGTLLGIGTLSGDVAALTTTALTIPGPHNITAVYGGSAIYNGSTSPILVETVTGGAATTTTLVSSLNPSTFGDAVTFTATVSVPNGMPTGTVTFMDGISAIGSASLSGGAAALVTSSLTVGTHSLTAVYAGDATFPGSTSPVLSQVVNPATTTNQRSFVSSGGADTNLCTLASPCRSLTAAIIVTSPGGEVIVLDSAGYGPTTITKPITISAASGVYAGISVLSGTGIVVNPGSGKVTLRGLTITGLGGTTGIDFQSGGALYVERTIVTGFSGAGLNATLPAAAELFIRGSYFRENGIGASLATGAGVVNPLDATIDRSQFENNATGLRLTGFSSTAAIRNSIFTAGTVGIAIQPTIGGAKSAVDMRNSTVSKGTTAGIVVGGNGAASATLSITGSQVTDNGIGIDAQAGGIAYVTASTIVRNTTGIQPLTGSIVSLGDNRLTNNGTNGTFSSTVSKQ